MLVPPDNYGLVEEGIYRCAKLDPLNFAFLNTLNLKSLILLDVEKPPRALLNFFEDKPTTLYHISRSGLKMIENQDDMEQSVQATHELPSLLSGYDKMEDWMIIRPTLIVEIFEILLNKLRHNVMIVDKTEAVIGLLRKMQKWSFSSIINEYRLYAANRSTYTTETFLELFKMELISFEENAAKEAEEETTQKGVKIERPIRNITRSSISSLSRSIEDLKLDSADFDDINLDQARNENLSLSASPQIPHELLKLAKQRKAKKHASAKDEAGSETDMARRYSDELLRSQESKYAYFSYYKSDGSQFDNLTHQGSKKGRAKIVLPEEKNLPSWFIMQRDNWEQIYREKVVASS